LVSLFFIIAPFAPAFWYWIKYDVFNYDWKATDSFSISLDPDGLEYDDRSQGEDNRILIPVIGVDSPIVEGDSEISLNQGVWHRPNTGNPEDGGNIVLTGHRFQYLPPNNLTFYHLDKVEEGDQIIVYWNEIEYDYVVTETFIVEPDSVEIEEDSAYPLLTLYTCTPLWTAEKRLVVRAEPTE
jgi:sortase A